MKLLQISHLGKKYTDETKGKEANIKMIQEFDEEFKKIHSSSKCSELLNCDLKTKEGQQYFAYNKLSETVCERCVMNAVELIDKLKS